MGEPRPALLLGTAIDSVQRFAESDLLRLRQLRQQPFIKGGLHLRLGVPQTLRLFRGEKQLAAAVLGVGLPDQVALGLQTGRTAGGGSLVYPELLPDLRLRDAGMVAHQMDEIVFRGADAVLLQRPDGQLAGLPCDFRDLALCEIHSVPFPGACARSRDSCRYIFLIG